MHNGRMTGNHVAISGRGGQYFFIDWQLAGQNITNNTSQINWQAYFHYNIADAQLDNGIASLSGTRWHNGGRVRNYGGQFSTRDVALASGSFTIGHNADGGQSISVSGGIDVYQSGRSSGAQTWSLPTIPRNSQVTTNDSGGWTLGTPLTIHTNRKSSSFTHTITIRLGGSSGTVLQTINSVGSQYVWTPSASQINTIQNSVPNANRALIHITQRNNQVGQNSTTQAWTYIRDANPVFNSFTYKDSNTAVTAITGNNQVLVKGKSTLEVTVPSGDKMVAQKGANPNYYAFAYDGVSNNVNYSTSDINSSFTNIDTVGSRAILVTAYDSRTNNTRVAKNVQVYDYTPPNIEIEVSRQNNWGDNVTVSTGGTFDLLPIAGSNKNSLTASSLKYRRREKGASTWGSWATIPFTVTDNGFAGTNQFITLDNTKEFEFEFEIADKFGTVTQTAELGRGTPLMFTGRKSDGSAVVGVGKIPEDGALDVEGDIYSNGAKVSTSDTKFKIGVIPKSTFGSTGNKAITGVGFKPKLVKFTLLTPADAGAANDGEGSMDAGGNQFVVSTGSNTTSGRTRNSHTGGCIGVSSIGSTTWALFARYVSMDEDGFTIEVTTASTFADVAYEAHG